MGKRVTYDVISYGEWTRTRMRNFREQCCDCGLIHRLDFRIVDAREGVSPRGTKGRSRASSRLQVEFRTRRDDRATAAARRTFKFTPDE
jgi:hypothetical protein